MRKTAGKPRLTIDVLRAMRSAGEDVLDLRRFNVPGLGVFGARPGENEWQIEHRGGIERVARSSTHRSVALKKIHPIQSEMQVDKLLAYAEGRGQQVLDDFGSDFSQSEYSAAPTIVKFDDRLVLVDGHHRVVGAALAGQRSIRAVVITKP